MVIFTKFDGQLIKEYTDLSDIENTDKWDRARGCAEKAFQTVYLPKVMDTKYPPKAYLKLEGRNGEHALPVHRGNSLTDMDLPEMDCPELTDKTADAVTDDSMHQLFVSTQRNNLDLCVKSAIQQVINIRYCFKMLTVSSFTISSQSTTTWENIVQCFFIMFPHFWVCMVFPPNGC